MGAHDISPSPSPTYSPRNKPHDALRRDLPLSVLPRIISRQPTFFKEFDPVNKSVLELPSLPPKSFPSSRVASQSKVHAPRPVEFSGDDDADGLSEWATDENEADADLIAETLSRYTTFKIDENVTAGAKSSPHPGADAPESPTTRESPSLPPPGHSMRLEEMSLEEMKSSLENMQTKRSRAEEEHDLATVSDLQSYAIPEIQLRIKEKEDGVRMEAEAKTEEIEHSARSHGVEAGPTSVHSLVASPVTAEDGGSSAENTFKTTEKAGPLLHNQWEGIHEDSANEEQKDRNDGRALHPLKKIDSTNASRNDDLADPSVRPARSAKRMRDPANRNTIINKTKQDKSPTRSLQNENRSSTSRVTRRPSRSPSSSESERGPVRRADTQLYEADSEGSEREEGTFERRDTWRRPTVEDEDIEEEEELVE